jgi:hypothetical protein
MKPVVTMHKNTKIYHYHNTPLLMTLPEMKWTAGFSSPWAEIFVSYI